MKIKHILLNILPFPIWVTYYLFSIPKKDLFIMPVDAWFLLLIIVCFTIYNLYSQRISDFLIRNFVMIVALTGGFLLSGQIYLKFFYYMSDEHYAVNSISFDIAVFALIITFVACLIKVLIDKIKKKRC